MLIKFPLSTILQWTLILISFFLVAFGQPAWLPWNGLIAAALGYALLWRVLLAYPSRQKRFWLAFAWFFAVQLVQMSWFLSHPFWYIYTVYLFICIWLGAQFGLLALFITPKVFGSSKVWSVIGNFLAIAALWTLLEWSRLFLLSGLSWNPAGLALAGNLYALQMASLWGVFGLSFWLIFVNLLALYAWVNRIKRPALMAVWIVAATLPYLYGAIQLSIHQKNLNNPPSTLRTLLVQTAFPVEESMNQTGMVNYVTNEWRQILQITKKHAGKTIDLIVLPEYVVPFGTFSYVYPLNTVMAAFTEIFETTNLKFLPAPQYPFAAMQTTLQGPKLFVNNAYWVQAIANYFQADMLVGLEDAMEVSPGNIEYYSSAQFTHPQDGVNEDALFAQRYDKRVLVPMGEYIPFTFCKNLAASYGIFGSFTPGQEAMIMTSKQIPLSPSICYEETYGGIMCEGRQKGAQLFVNLTSDVWYPNSKLPQQHLEHARLRTVENGIPLIRACNTGVTSAIDSFGRTLATLGGEHPEKVEWVPDALLADIPIYTYQTLYALYGDKMIASICLFILFITIIANIVTKKSNPNE